MEPITNAQRALPLAAAIRLPDEFTIVDQRVTSGGSIVLSVLRVGDDEPCTIAVTG